MNVFAVVIGNNDYFDPDKLANAVADGQAMEEVFVRLGYTTTHFYNFHKTEIPSIMETIEQELPKYDASIFYYAGHGFQVDGENFLPAVDCQISTAGKYQLRQESLVLTELLDLYRPHSTKTHIIILDACRNRPANRGGKDSFAPINAPQGTLIAFSTSPNSSALDGGAGGHGLYTAALLTYIGRENLTVEALFKKVRRTVAQWSNNRQIPWEHTSLIGNFFFNAGQMVVSPQIPYREDVVKDSEYTETGGIADLINEIRVLDYNRQNPAIEKLRGLNAASLDKNQQFIFGRNLLQSSAWAFSAQSFMSSLTTNLRKYTTGTGENHILNGILFEIYFDSHGEFRQPSIKRNDYFDAVMALRKRDEYAKSFEFIRTLLAPYKENLLYVVPEYDDKLDVDITLRQEKVIDDFGEERIYSLISAISVNGSDITDRVSRRYHYERKGLKETIANVAKAPVDAVVLHTNLPLEGNVKFEDKLDIDDL